MKVIWHRCEQSVITNSEKAFVNVELKLCEQLPKTNVVNRRDNTQLAAESLISRWGFQKQTIGVFIHHRMVSRARFLCRLSKCAFCGWDLLLSGNQRLKCCRSCFTAKLFKTDGFEESAWINCGLMLWILISEVMSGFKARISGFMRECGIS